MSKSEKIKNFDPNGVGVNNGRFISLPFEESEVELVLVSVPWDVTVSFGAGTASGPRNILDSSIQLDLYQADYPQAWKHGIFMRPSPDELFKESRRLRRMAETYIEELEAGKKVSEYPGLQKIQREVNAGCLKMIAGVRKTSLKLLAQDKKVGLVGGDHSTSLGLLQALAEQHDFGVLQIDAHQDLRKAYEGFTYSHASIFYNALQLPQIKKLVQVGVRDHCDEEVAFLEKSGGRVELHHMNAIRESQYNGQLWSTYVDKIIAGLPDKVYISFDIDGLDPGLCPQTGTPVPGGLSFEEASYLIKRLSQSGKEIIGFDLTEVAGLGNDWDGNVGARVLYILSGALLANNDG